jgi:hypothetical protein
VADEAGGEVVADGEGCVVEPEPLLEPLPELVLPVEGVVDGVGEDGAVVALPPVPPVAGSVAVGDGLVVSWLPPELPVLGLSVVEGVGVVVECEELPPVKALPMVVPLPWPLMFWPEASSTTVMPPMVSPKASATATAGRFHRRPRARARWTVPSE